MNLHVVARRARPAQVRWVGTVLCDSKYTVNLLFKFGILFCEMNLPVVARRARPAQVLWVGTQLAVTGC